MLWGSIFSRWALPTSHSSLLSGAIVCSSRASACAYSAHRRCPGISPAPLYNEALPSKTKRLETKTPQVENKAPPSSSPRRLHGQVVVGSRVVRKETAAGMPVTWVHWSHRLCSCAFTSLRPSKPTHDSSRLTRRCTAGLVWDDDELRGPGLTDIPRPCVKRVAASRAATLHYSSRRHFMRREMVQLGAACSHPVLRPRRTAYLHPRAAACRLPAVHACCLAPALPYRASLHPAKIHATPRAPALALQGALNATNSGAQCIRSEWARAFGHNWPTGARRSRLY